MYLNLTIFSLSKNLNVQSGKVGKWETFWAKSLVGIDKSLIFALESIQSLKYKDILINLNAASQHHSIICNLQFWQEIGDITIIIYIPEIPE